jgi:hypothetical protein
MWTASHRVLGYAPLTVLGQPELTNTDKKVRLALGADIVRLRPKDFTRLVAAAAIAVPGSSPPPGWYPEPMAAPDHRQLRYWDGTQWTSQTSN